MNIFNELWQGFKAWRRGEVRTHPYGLRGRVYKHRSALKSPGDKGYEPPPSMAAKACPKLTIRYKVYRAKLGKWFDEQGNEIKD
jgi:hypothetical protein